jgi:hypothetical protein
MYGSKLLFTVPGFEPGLPDALPDVTGLLPVPPAGGMVIPPAAPGAELFMPEFPPYIGITIGSMYGCI